MGYKSAQSAKSPPAALLCRSGYAKAIQAGAVISDSDILLNQPNLP